MLNDSLASVLSNITNAEKIGRQECTYRPYSKLIADILNILIKENYIGKFEVINDTKGKLLKINLLGKINKVGVIKPRFSVKKGNFEKFEKRFLPAKDFGILIVSTSKGVMTHNEAKEKKIGGKLIAYCY
jgi:small subunit ribosomal protein S8